MEQQQPQVGFIRRFFRGVGRLITWLRHALLNLVFLLTVIILIALLSYSELPTLPEKGALILNPQGVVVDQLSFSGPFKNFLGKRSPEEQETLLQDMIDAIVLAKDDKRISSLVMELDYLSHAGISKMQEIAVALAAFRSSGKKIIAVGDNFSQDQYWLAAQADEIYMHPMGGVLLQGYGVYRNYFKRALDKLQVNFHVFRVGDYKSALEPVMRQDMSPQAKQANLAWLSVLWQQYVSEVATQRGLTEAAVNRYVNEIDQLLADYQGNTAAVAEAVGLVDGLKNRDEMNQYLLEVVGAANKDGFYEGVGFEHYLWVRNYENHETKQAQHIGVIVARGMIVDGERPAGGVGGDSLAALIREAREEKQVKALVLRIDSGGGSAFASEIIRRELQLLKAAGKPLVVSMGSIAASGGYWIASLADEIWATPTTITGSIGIFGAFPTLENSLQSLGVNTDGVGTTRLAGAMRIDRPLAPVAERAIQATVEHGYRQFIDVVARGRDMSPQAVEKIAGGRVWSGVDAQRLGLVDQLGGMDEAIDAAAALASLDNFESRLIELPLSPGEKLLQQLTAVMAPSAEPLLAPGLQQWLAPIKQEVLFWTQLNDPKGVYVLCPACSAP